MKSGCAQERYTQPIWRHICRHGANAERGFLANGGLAGDCRESRAILFDGPARKYPVHVQHALPVIVKHSCCGVAPVSQRHSPPATQRRNPGTIRHVLVPPFRARAIDGASQGRYCRLAIG